MSRTLKTMSAEDRRRLEIKAKHGLAIVRAVMDEAQEEQFVRDIYDNFPEASMTLRCHGWNYKQFRFDFVDTEDGGEYEINLPGAILGFRALVFDVISGRFPGLGLGSNFLQGTEHWDAFGFDAAAQFAALGDVIYG